MTYKKFLEQTEKAKTEFIKRIRQYEDVTSKEIDNIEISWDYIRISLYFQTEKMNLSIYGNTMAQKMNCLVYILM